ncbi:MAG TPA: TIGR01459 family HAD-type hydrolase [Geminicoccaceae bacterium]|jgi:HAD superfamily hydrolase (TIGR01459 family)|nr:TIGR01459 family HAD-type hydrolase [Geminicoccaceae bacterium]
MIEPTFCSGLADLASRYRGFIVDQWGVLHDGARPYADALDCLARLRAGGKRVVLLSNSGKRTAINRARLAEIGIDPSLYDAVVTSGEATWQALAERIEPFFAALGRRCILWSRYGDRSVVEGLPLEVVERVEDAEFLLLAGVEDDAHLEDFGAQLETAAAHGLPMVCANPDIVAVLPDGRFGTGPGALAHHYEQLGGAVGYVGKPHHPIYHVCLEALGHPPHAEVLTVGDSMAHDVAGGAAMELDTALIMSGIHRRIFDVERGVRANRAALEELAREYGVLPRWVLPRFRWAAY